MGVNGKFGSIFDIFKTHLKKSPPPFVRWKKTNKKNYFTVLFIKIFMLFTLFKVLKS